MPGIMMLSSICPCLSFKNQDLDLSQPVLSNLDQKMKQALHWADLGLIKYNFPKIIFKLHLDQFWDRIYLAIF